MASSAARLLRDPGEAAQLAQAARRSAAERFSLARHLAQVLAIYDRVTDTG
ncbi:hypothetical protein P775_06415 [Puniceibacterium antarcticum]|uniref:Glycosyl transferase family 1 domain-containing protein n=1 Tax=Puniceibacterium antarcticum TaxID=1206336 RepID=A0A2G8RIU4_9RHOB|nr:hypothetical protein P775_06415 [Puniceibacterium antarcticum]